MTHLNGTEEFHSSVGVAVRSCGRKCWRGPWMWRGSRALCCSGHSGGPAQCSAHPHFVWWGGHPQESPTWIRLHIKSSRTEPCTAQSKLSAALFSKSDLVEPQRGERQTHTVLRQKHTQKTHEQRQSNKVQAATRSRWKRGRELKLRPTVLQ